jgi:hypothetical protein
MSYGPQDAIARIQEIARRLDGMREAPEYPPENLNQFPFSLAYLRDGETTFESGWRKSLWTISWELYFARQILPNTVRAAMPFCERVLEALQTDTTLGGTVDTVVSPVKSAFGWLEYGSADNKLLGWRFTVVVKQRT